MRIVVVGCGYVGFPLAVLLSREHDVTVVDTDVARVRMIGQGEAPISDPDMARFFPSGRSIGATEDGKTVYRDADIIFIAVPTDYSESLSSLDTGCVEAVLSDIFALTYRPIVVIRSTAPIGFADDMRERYPRARLLFSPEFLKEGFALADTLRPTRIIVGAGAEEAARRDACTVAHVLRSIAENDPPVMLMSLAEGEAVKLFANTYLAMRVAFFNELDTYAECRSLDAERVISGVCADGRIGNYYNNPSFGYGGYCLPKDAKQLCLQYGSLPQAMIYATVASNALRARYVAERILSHSPKTVGIFRLSSKADSDSIRHAAILDVMHHLQGKVATLLVYEPTLKVAPAGTLLVNDLVSFKEESDIIVANRYDAVLHDVRKKLYTRDLFFRN